MSPKINTTDYVRPSTAATLAGVSPGVPTREGRHRPERGDRRHRIRPPA
jgi:hypothetical protein